MDCQSNITEETMDNIYEELENIFQNFRWIDNIPEDQYRRDEICLEARAAFCSWAHNTWFKRWEFL